MKKVNSGTKLILIFLLMSFLFSITLCLAQELTEEFKNTSNEEGKIWTRIVISTSGPAKFNSYWQDEPPRLLIEFQSKNVQSKIPNEVMVNQGIIKKITSSYFEEDPKRPLKSLSFELAQRVPYKIWQEDNTILLDMQTPQELLVFPDEGKEVFAKNEPKDAIIKRLEAMDTALKQVIVTPVPPEAAILMPSEVAIQMLSETPKSEVPKLVEFPKSPVEFPQARREGKMDRISWFMGLVLLAGLGFLLRLRRDKLILISKIRILIDTFKQRFKFKNRKKDILATEIARLKVELEEKNKLFEQEEIIRKAIENTSISRQKEFEQLKSDLQQEVKLLEQEEKVRRITEQSLTQKEKECQKAKESYESLKEVLIDKGMVKLLTTPGQEGELWISGKSAEKREFIRLDLTKDYNRTIILRIDGERSRRIESANKLKNIKSFANNISLGGLSFETRHEFKEKDKINVRLFFFGDKVPMMRLQAKVMWSKLDPPVNRYGIYFTGLEEKEKTELKRYIESKIAK